MKKNIGKKKTGLLKGVMLITKIALASGLSWELAKMLGSKHPYLAPLTVILSIQETVQHMLFTELSALFSGFPLPFLLSII